MKRTFFSIYILALVMGGCKPEIKGDLGELSNKDKGMNGDWELSQFITQDPNSPILEERDLSEMYIAIGVTPMHIQFHSTDHSYTVENTMGRNFFGTSGNWHLDDPIAPTTLTLESATDTMNIALGRMVSPSSTDLSLVLDRTCSDGFKNVIYKFNFKRVNP